MTALLGLKPYPVDLLRFEHVRAHLERETGAGR